jgi:ABC-type Mn2+/Zn2+ transport system permease subunit
MNLLDFWHYDFLQKAMLATVLLAINCGLISPMVVAKRYAFLGSALSHSTLLGVALALAFFPGHSSLLHFALTLVVTLLLTTFLAHATLKEQSPSDAFIGIFYSITMGLGVMIHSLFNQGQGELLNILFGNILLVTTADLILMGSLSLILLLALIIPFQKWCFFLYDTEGAKRFQIPVKIYHYALFFLMTTVIVASLKLAGTVLVNTLLIIPGFFAIRFAQSMRGVFIISVGFSLCFSLLALIVANASNLPIGASFAVVQFIGLILGFTLLKKT